MFAALLLSASLATPALAAERFPAPEFRTDYKLPATQTPPPAHLAWNIVDLVALAGGMALIAWFVHKRRWRAGVLITALAAVAYFGFYRKGCVCPVGSIQNVAFSIGGHGYALPWNVALIFLLPLLFALFHGRVFCAGVCPLGAIQDVLLWRPKQIPRWLDEALGLIPFAYLGLAVMLAVVGSDFVICRYDPFVGIFRRNATAPMLLLGAGLLALGMFVGRPYCRFLCPYGVLLRFLSPFSSKRVDIAPDDKCIDCRLCQASCPFGAIRYPLPDQATQSQRRRGLAIAILSVPILTGLLAVAGFYSGNLLSRIGFDVRLADQFRMEEQNPTLEPSLETAAARTLSREPAVVQQQAEGIQKRMRLGSACFGAWMGLVIGLKLVRTQRPQRRKGYVADPAGCLACARCFASCPVKAKSDAEMAAT